MIKQIILARSVVVLLFTFTVCFSQTSDTLDGYRAGFYKGQAFNTTANARGKVVFELYDLDQKNDHVRAYFGASEGLEGENSRRLVNF